MNIRTAKIIELDTIRQLYYDTITNVNIKDYELKQISLWASAYHDIESWRDKFQNQHLFIAEMNEKITGFG